MKKYVIIFALLTVHIAGIAQEPFNGRISMIDGKGIKARVVVEDSKKITFSDSKGRFGLTDIDEDDVLLIIHKRDTMRIGVEGRKSIEIIVDEQGDHFDVNESEELANYGFGYVKRRESTDFSSGISGDRLRATGAMGIIEAIQMCYPGLKYINGELCLRTQNSVNCTSPVLILCDGMEISPEAINIHDVKSVEIIKESNIYGFRGVNGVILIKTMNGEDALKHRK